VGRYSSVGIATGYGLDGPRIEFRWRARFSVPVQTGPGAHPATYAMGSGSLSGIKRPGRRVYQQHHLAKRLKKEWSYISTPLNEFVTTSRVTLAIFPLPDTNKITHQTQCFQLSQSKTHYLCWRKSQDLRAAVNCTVNIQMACFFRQPNIVNSKWTAIHKYTMMYHTQIKNYFVY